LYPLHCFGSKIWAYPHYSDTNCVLLRKLANNKTRNSWLYKISTTHNATRLLTNIILFTEFVSVWFGKYWIVSVNIMFHNLYHILIKNYNLNLRWQIENIHPKVKFSFYFQCSTCYALRPFLQLHFLCTANWILLCFFLSVYVSVPIIMFGNVQVLAGVFGKTSRRFQTFYWNYLLCGHLEIKSLLTFTVVAVKRLFTRASISVIHNIIDTFSSVLTRIDATRKLVCNVRKHHWYHYFLLSWTNCLLHTKPHTMAVASHYDNRTCIPE